MEKETVFIEGLFLNKVADTAPSFIITNQVIHMETLYNWLKANKHLADEKGYLRITGKEGQSGKRYFQVDNWKPKQEQVVQSIKELPIVQVDTLGTGAVKNVDDIPF